MITAKDVRKTLENYNNTVLGPFIDEWIEGVLVPRFVSENRSIINVSQDQVFHWTKDVYPNIDMDVFLRQMEIRGFRVTALSGGTGEYFKIELPPGNE